jgi:U11/U12 small nuclear ribonucleoprotein SNRNP20
MNGIQHRTMRKIYYDSFQDPEVILAEDARKNPCRQFLSTGECKFGSVCKFSHLTPADKQQLLIAVAAKHSQTVSGQCDTRGRPTTSHSQHSGALQQGNTDGASTQSSHETENSVNLQSLHCYRLPTTLEGISNLPPSLQPPPSEAFDDVLPVQWG